MIKVKKRNNNLEPLDITKIQEKTSSAVKGLSGVSQSELEVDSQLQFFNGITTEQIQETLIKTAVDKIDIDRPNWTYVAARLFLKDLYHKVGKVLNSSKGSSYGHIKEYFSFGEKEGKILIGLKEKYNLEKINKSIVPERDLLFTYLGIKTFHDRYILKTKNGEPFELPQHLFMAVSMFIFQNETDPKSMNFLTNVVYKNNPLKQAKIPTPKELKNKYSGEELAKEVRTIWAIEIYNIVSEFKAMFATPTLSNARTPRHQLSSCFVSSTPDNIEGIFDTYKEHSLLSKYGGGIGSDWTQIRSLGGYIDNHKSAAGGLIPFLKIENDVAIAVDQLGCVAKDSYVKVLKKVITKDFEHDFRKEYEKYDFSDKELIEGIASYAEKFAFKYGKFTKNFIRSLIFDYIINKKGHKFLEELYGLSHDQYKKIIEKYKRIEKGLPEGFETIKGNKKYAISKEGIVINTNTLRPLSRSIDKKGYERVTIGKNEIPLHKLLVTQFIKEDIEDLTINHIDGNKLNNSIENLEIISNKKNIALDWKISYRKRTEMARIRKYLSNGIKLNGNKRNTNRIEILDIETIVIPINKVKIGDLILSYNIEKKEEEYKPVISKHDIDIKKEDQIKIVYENGNYIITSVWHPTPKVVGDKIIYVRADSLNEGDKSINDLNEEVLITEISKPNISEEFMDLSVRDNNNYFCSTEKNNGSFHLIHNTRKGAIAVYIEPWHGDLMDFLDLKKNSGEERRRAHDLFPALWLNDLFMKRVENNENWTLFNPEEVSDLSELYGEEFEKRYIEYENDDSIEFKEVFNAKEIWKRILVQYFETGSPFLCQKDNANRANPNRHKGIIRSSNLCTEIYQNTSPNYYKVKVEYSDGTIEYYNEKDIVKTDAGIEKFAKKISSIDSINGKQVYFVEKVAEEGETAVCNLGSVNLSRTKTKEDLESVTSLMTRALDNVIDLNFYPTRKTKETNLKTRAIGLGVMGESQLLAEEKIYWGSEEHMKKIDEIMEIISYNAINASIENGKEKGLYENFEGSDWSKGILPIDNANKNAKDLISRETIYNWDELRENAKKGMRNGYLMAIAPTSSISILVGTTQAIEPVYKRKWFEENLSGLIPVVVPKLSPDTWQYYETAYELDQIKLIKVGAIRQKWIDQGQSLNIFIRQDKASAGYLNNIYMKAWELGLKSNYYLRAESPESQKEAVADRTTECFGCQ